jgi:hypothetical protein
VLFSGGSELTLIQPPRLLEAARTDGVDDFGSALATLVPVVFQPGEATQRTGGGSNPRLGNVFNSEATPASDYQTPDSTCLVVSDDALMAASFDSAVRAWGMRTVRLGGLDRAGGTIPVGYVAVDEALATTAAVGPIDCIIVVTRNEGKPDEGSDPAWQRALDAHRQTAAQLLQHAAWARAAARYAAGAGRPLRVVHVSAATTAAGRTTTQAVAQLARSMNDMAWAAPIDTFAISLETSDSQDLGALSHLVARLARSQDGLSLRGAELVSGHGWVGLRSHPGPAATVTFGGPEIPPGVIDALRQAL